MRFAKFCGQFVISNNLKAACVAVFFACVPVLQWFLSGVPIALVTLRRGWASGAKLLVLALLILFPLWKWMQATEQFLLLYTLGVWLPCWYLAGMLRQTVSLAQTILFATAVVTIVSVMFYLAGYVPTETALLQQLSQMPQLADMYQYQGFSGNEQQEALQMLTSLLLYSVPVLLLSCHIAMLLLARWLQALLFNPGGFAKEFQQLRFSKKSVIFVALAIVAMHFSGVEWLKLAVGLLLFNVMMLPGLSLLHWWVNYKQLSGVWLFIFYAWMLVIGIPVVAIVGVADSWFNFRQRLLRLSKR